MMVRNANLDAFRCLVMFLVVLGHVYKHGIYFRTDRCLELLFQGFTLWHVNAFLALSGWFGIKFTLSKFVRLWGLVVFVSVVSIIVGRHVLHEPTRFAITGGWYGNTYLCLMLIAPFLNAGIEGIVAKGFRCAWLAWLGFAIVMLINWVSGNSYVGLIAYDIGPFTLVQMVFVYLTVRLVRLTDVSSKVRLWQIAVVIAIFLVGCTVIRGPRSNYIAPYVIAMSVAMLLLFEHYVRVPNWLGRICVWAAPSMFSVYLLHEMTSFGKLFHRISVGWLAARGVCPFLAIVLGAAFCFGVCLSLDGIRRLGMNLISKGMAHARGV